MSDAAETTGAGATRVLFGTLGFILIMNGTEHMNQRFFFGPLSTGSWWRLKRFAFTRLFLGTR